MPYREADVEGSETRVMQSELTGKKYLISVGLPYGYHEEPDKKWPVVYHIDGNVYFGMITDIVRSMAWCGPTSDAVVVGIGYASDAQLREAWDQRIRSRTHDLTPVRDEEFEKTSQEEKEGEVRTGGANQFLAFVKADVISFVESNFRVDPNESTLAGHSFGGLFTVFVMLHHPGLFKNYVACSPSVRWLRQDMLRIEEAFARIQRALPLKLFLSMGELEKSNASFDEMQRLFQQLRSQGFEKLELEMRLFEDEDHCTVIAPSLAAGLKMALRVE